MTPNDAFYTVAVKMGKAIEITPPYMELWNALQERGRIPSATMSELWFNINQQTQRQL